MPPKKVLKIDKGQRTLSFVPRPLDPSTSAVEVGPSPYDSEDLERGNVRGSDFRESDASLGRKFRQAWLNEFRPWLRHDPQKGMLCDLCLEKGRANSFTQGCTNYRHSAIIDHLKTKDHSLSRSVDLLLKNNEKCREKMDTAEEKAALVALKAVLWLVLEDLPLSKYCSLMKLLKELEVPFVDKLNLNAKTNYESYDSAMEFLNALSKTAEDSLRQKLVEAEAVTVLADESTDITTQKKLVIYAQIVDKKLQPSTHFISNVECTNGTGEGIADTVVQTMGNFGVPVSKIMGFGSDGASVMTGRGKRATGMLLRNNPHLVNIHCVAHRLALCTSQAAESVPGMKDFHDTICKLFYYFKRAPAHVARFAEIQCLLDDPQLKIREVHGVRWLSFYEALEVVFQSLDSLLTYFQENDDAKAIGLRRKIATTRFISLAYLMMDVIPVVTKLSLYFQKQNIDIAQLQVKLSAALDELELLKNSEGEDAVGHYRQLLLTDLTKRELNEDAPA